MRRRDWLTGMAAGWAAGRAQGQASPRISKITGSADHTLVLFADGTVGGWGDLRDGQLGPRAAIPARSGHAAAYVPIAVPGRAVDVASTGRTALAVLDDGTVAAWGYGANGELGCGEEGRNGTETPRVVPGLAGVARIDAAGSTVLAVHRDGTLSGWGSRGDGMFGDGVAPEPLTPPRKELRPVKLAGIAGIAQVSVGMGHVLALTAAGRAMAWGKLPYGIVYTDDEVAAAHEVPGLGEVAQVVATGVAAALRRDGTVWVWGHNGQAQFGNGRRDQMERTRVPVRVPGVTNVTQLAGGNSGRHFLGLRREGSIVAWGNSDFGQVGNGRFGEAQPSVVTLGLKGVRQLFAAGGSSYAEDSGGSWWIWGRGSVYRAWPMGPDAHVPVRWSIPEGVRVAR